MSYFQERGFSLSIWQPNITIASAVPNTATYVCQGQHVADLVGEVQAYQHELRALGGFWQASFTLKGNTNDLEDWVERGLNRHVEVYDEAQQMLWEGFVDSVSYSAGPLRAKRGPVSDIRNKLRLVYRLLYTGVVPAEEGAEKRTAWYEDDDSEALYGIQEVILSGDPCTDADSIQRVQSVLTESAWPNTDNELSTSASEPQVTIDCLGYVHRLNYSYQDLTMVGGAPYEQDASEKIEYILDYDVAGLFSSANAAITANTVQVPQYENSDTTAWNIIKTVVARGDAAFARWLFGVYTGRKAIYAAAPTDFHYERFLTDPEQRIYTVGGEEVVPWRIEPGKWLLYSDYLAGRVPEGTDPISDPRAQFIETVTYTMPYGLQLRAGASYRMQQVMAAYGLSGV